MSTLDDLKVVGGDVVGMTGAEIIGMTGAEIIGMTGASPVTTILSATAWLVTRFRV